MAVADFGFAFLAGALSILSPCVLPLLPIILGGAAAKHRFAPVALAAGLAVSFTVVGLFVALVGYAIGIDEGVFRMVAAVLLIAFGATLLLPAVEARFAMATGPIVDWGSRASGAVESNGLLGQFATGALLGAVWSPCVGPTLGGVALLLAQGNDLAGAALAMLLLGIGAAFPLLLIAAVSRSAILRWRGSLAWTGKGAKRIFGAALVVFGLLTLTGLDRWLQTELVQLSPGWLTDVTTAF